MFIALRNIIVLVQDLPEDTIVQVVSKSKLKEGAYHQLIDIVFRVGERHARSGNRMGRKGEGDAAVNCTLARRVCVAAFRRGESGA